MFDHLKEKNLTYVEHAKGALSMALTTVKATGAILVHTIYPDILQDTLVYIFEIIGEVSEDR